MVVEEWSDHRKVDSGPDDAQGPDRSPVRNSPIRRRGNGRGRYRI